MPSTKNILIRNRYRIETEIGSGGMAKVFQATDILLKRQVAIKILKKDFKTTKEEIIQIRRFNREKILMSKLVSTNLVEIYDVFDEGGLNGYVMELIDGYTLKELIKKYAPLPCDQVIKIMTKIISGVTVMHKAEIVHRDLKPQNILITDSGEIKVADFGIAFLPNLIEMTGSSEIVGSPQYISPEMLTRENMDKRSDIYALGIILFEMLTGELPFHGKSPKEVVLKHLHNVIPNPQVLIDVIPNSLVNIIYKSTIRDFTKRYSDVSKMLADLSVCMDENKKNQKLINIKSNYDNVMLRTTDRKNVSKRERMIEPHLENKFKDRTLKNNGTYFLYGGLVITFIAIIGAIIALVLDITGAI